MENVLIIVLSIITTSNIFMVFILRGIFDRIGALCGMYLEKNTELIDKARKGDLYLQNGKND